MRFEGFYGNDNAKEQLSGAFASARQPHAILIDGPEGAGKRTLAKIIAQAAVCERNVPSETPTVELPCGRCRQCINARGDGHPDIAVYSGTGGARSFSVDTVRHIRMDASVSPNDAAKKVYILTDVQNMTDSAQNALLKILEEPPHYVMFILTCAGRSRVLDTIQSRATLVSVGPVTEDAVVAALLEQDPTLDPDQVRAAAKRSGGIIGRAKSGLAQGSYTAAADLSVQFAEALCGSDAYRFLRLSGLLEKDAALFTAFVVLLPLLFRDAYASKAGAQSSLSGCGAATATLAGNLSRRQIYQLTQYSLTIGAAVERYVNKTLLLNALFSRLWLYAHDVELIGA